MRYLNFKTIKKIVLCLILIISFNSIAQTTVTSISALIPYLDDNNVNIKMTPGTYEIGPDDVTSGLLPNATIFEFSGSNSTYDFTGVTFKFDTAIFKSYGKVEVVEIRVLGNNNVLKNLTMEDIGDGNPYKTVLGIKLDGLDNKLEGFHMTIRGSFPYGYGDLFGKGSGAVINHYKHSALLVRGERNHVKGFTIIHRAYGHAIFVQGGIDTLIEDCYIEGELRTTDDVLLEKGTGTRADDVDFMTVWGYTVPSGYMFSLQEDGIRAYNTGSHYLTGETTNTKNMTVKNCTMKAMRSGVTIGFCDNTKYVENCTAIGTENAFWVGSGGEVVNCKADAAHGVAYSTDYNTDSGAKVDITLIDSEYEYYGKHPLVYLGGSGHEVTINSERDMPHYEGYLRVSGVRNGMRYFGDRDPKYFDQAANDIVLNNFTNNPVVLDQECNEATVLSCGSVTNNGTNNSVSQSNACGSLGTNTSCDLPYTRNDIEITNRLVNHTSSPIDISCASSVKISMDLTSVQQMETADYLNIYYQLDEGNWQVISENVDSFSAKTVSIKNISGNSLRLRYQSLTNVDAETYTVSNILVSEEIVPCDLPYTRSDFEVTNRLVNHISDPINISCASSVKISMDLTSVQQMETSDYLNIYYQLDEGNWQVISENVDSFSAKTVSVNNISGNSLRLKYQSLTNVDAETYTVSNILVSEEISTCDLPYTRSDFEVTNRLVNHTSDPIDISCTSSVKISMDLTSVPQMETADYLNIYYQVDGGNWQVISENVDSFAAKTVTVNNVSGNSLRLRYLSFNNVDEETYTVSNILVSDNSQSNKSTESLKEVLDINMYPNPINSVAIIKNASNTTFNLYNMNGSKIFTKAITKDSEQIDLSTLSSGMYYGEIIGIKTRKTMKVIKN